MSNLSSVLRCVLATAVCAVSIATSINAQVPVVPRRDSIPVRSVLLPPILVTGRLVPTEGRSCCGEPWPLSARQAALDSLAAGRRRWEVSHPASYRIAAGIGCGFCGSAEAYLPRGTYPVARVRGRELFATGNFHPAERISEGISLAVPVDSLFRLLEKTANDTARKITDLKLDTKYGFPRSWATDGAHNGSGGVTVTDQDDWGRVIQFVPDEPPTRCGWWRRIMRNCPTPYPPLENEIRGRIGVERMARPAADRPLPQFPPELRSAGEDGTVRVRYGVDASGRPMERSLDIMESTQGLFMSAVDEVIERWVFTPARAEGRRVPSLYEEVFEFRAPRATQDPESVFVTRDTTPDGIPRTIIGFRPRAPNP